MKVLILRAKHWQIFLLLFAPHLASWYVQDATVDAFLNLLSIFILTIWLILQVNELSSLRPSQAGYNINWFLMNAFLVLSAWAYSVIMEDPSFYISTTSWHAEGVRGWVFLYVAFAYLHMHWFPASLLYTTEHGQRPDFSQTVKWFLLYFFWPIGVWFIQPRLNKLQEEIEWEREALSKLDKGK